MQISKRSKKATFIGIGAQKCASTWLYGVLQQCRDVAVSKNKEVDFFSYHFDRGYEWYEREFVRSQPSLHRGEISPSYMIHPSAAERAAAYNPDLEVFVMLRDPIARAYSNHLHEVRKGHVSGDNLIFENALNNNPLYLDQSLYSKHLCRWYDLFPKNQIHVYFQEEVFTDSEAQAARIVKALNLNPLNSFLDLKANESVQYKNAAVGRTLWKIGSFARSKGLGGSVEKIKALPMVRNLRQLNRVEMRAKIAPLEHQTKTSLTDYFGEDVSALQKLIGRSAPWDAFSTGSDAAVTPSNAHAVTDHHT